MVGGRWLDIVIMGAPYAGFEEVSVKQRFLSPCHENHRNLKS